MSKVLQNSTILSTFIKLLADAMVIYVSTLPWIPTCFWKRKVGMRSTPLSRNPNSPMKQIRIFLAWRNQTPHRGVLPVLPQKRPHVKEMCDYSGYRKCKLKTVLCSYNNALCDSSKLFLQQLTLEKVGLWIFSAKCDVIFRFRRISFNMPQGFMRMPR